ncbi:hypothetical protein EGW08_000883, partial [Elysia chlorotica]
RSRRSKLAVAILFGSHDEKDEENYNQFQNFFFSHFALFEAHVEKLKSTIEIAYFNNRNFLPTIMEALELFRNDVYDLYMTQRLAEPVWLTMMSATTYKTKLCEKFMDTFTWLVTKFDNKNCKFFVSTLLSAVLTQHLAWVATVTPAGGTPAHTYQDKHTAKWVDTLAKTHPYNPLWAQLGDLFGAIGVPRKISRTVVVGKKADIVKKFLYVLSYFIRCSEVHENTDPQCLNLIVNEPYLDVSLSPTTKSNVGRPKVIRSCDSCRCCENSSSQSQTNCISKSSVVSESSQPDHNEVFSVGLNGIRAPSLGLSELHNYIVPHSLPIETNAFDKSLPPVISAIENVPNFPTSEVTDFSNFSEQVVRSQSFSGGKVRSRLSQQLETNIVQSSVVVNKGKSAEILKFLSKSNCGMLSSNLETSNVVKKPQEGVEDSRCVETSSGTCACISLDNRKDAEAKALNCRQSNHYVRPTYFSFSCRSVTPTGLSRRRHLSSTGSIDYEAFDPMIHCKEVKMPFAIEDCGEWQIRAFDRNFGRSLLASYSDHYLSDFVLHGTSDADYRPRLLNDLQSTVKHSILDEPIDEAVCVIADTDQWTVEVASSKVMGISPSGCTPWTSSKIVADLIESVVEISRLKMSSEFCLMHLEDRLQEIYFKSHMLSEYLTGAKTYSQRELTSMLGFETSDMALLMAVAGTHSPGLSQFLSA